MTTCPSKPLYAFQDRARSHINQHYRRPLPDRFIRFVLSKVLLSASISFLLFAGKLVPRGLFDAKQTLERTFHCSPKIPPISRNDDPQSFSAKGLKRKRVAPRQDVHSALNTDINDATIRLLRRLGCGCYRKIGVLWCLDPSHGNNQRSHVSSQKSSAWRSEIQNEGLTPSWSIPWLVQPLKIMPICFAIQA